MYTYLDLFTGTAGAALAMLDIAKSRCFCDNNPYVQANLQRLMAGGLLPKVPIFPDVKRHNMFTQFGHVDIITPGSPCVGHSSITMGNALGFDDHRSATLFDVVKIVARCTPKLIILENSPRILNNEQMQCLQWARRRVGTDFSAFVTCLAQSTSYAR